MVDPFRAFGNTNFSEFFDKIGNSWVRGRSKRCFSHFSERATEESCKALPCDSVTIPDFVSDDVKYCCDLA